MVRQHLPLGNLDREEGGMKIKTWIAASGLALVLWSATTATLAGPSECQVAIDAYNSAADDVSSAVRRYSHCVSGSEGKDDCSLEFGTLQSAQSDFESAVSDYGNDCQ